MALLDSLEWRYATKKMNGEVVPQDKLDYILEAARLAPSSSGLQPYKVFVISNKEILEQIRPVAWNQSVITECSHLLVFAAWDGYSLEKIETVFNEMMEVRGLPLNTMDAYKSTLWGMYEPLGQEWHATHAAKQAYISFGLAEQGLKSVVLLPLGYRDAANDWNANLKKYRKTKEELVVEIK